VGVWHNAEVPASSTRSDCRDAGFCPCREEIDGWLC